MAAYEAPKITELGSLVELTQGALGADGNDFVFVQALNRAVEAGVGDDISY